MTGADWWQQVEQELRQQWESEQTKQQRGQPSPVDDGIFEENEHGIYCK